MDNRIMVALDRYTQKYLHAVIHDDKNHRTWCAACINSVYAYTGDEEAERFAMKIHYALLEISYKMWEPCIYKVI